MNRDYLNNLGRGSPRKHFCQVIMKSVQWFLTKRCFKFSIKIYRENKPCPLRPCFSTNPNGLNNLGTESSKEHLRKIIWKSVQWFLTRRFFKFSIHTCIDICIGKISPTPWRPCFPTNPNGLNNLGTESPKEHLCKIIWKSVQWFLTRRLFKFSISRYMGKISPLPWRPCLLTNPNGLNNLGRGSPKEHFCKIIWKLVQWFLTRRLFKFSI